MGVKRRGRRIVVPNLGISPPPPRYFPGNLERYIRRFLVHEHPPDHPAQRILRNERGLQSLARLGQLHVHLDVQCLIDQRCHDPRSLREVRDPQGLAGIDAELVRDLPGLVVPDPEGAVYPIPAPIRFAVEEYGHHPHVRPYLPPRVQPQRPIVAEASEFRRFGAVAEVGGEVRETVEVDLRRHPLVVPGRWRSRVNRRGGMDAHSSCPSTSVKPSQEAASGAESQEKMKKMKSNDERREQKNFWRNWHQCVYKTIGSPRPRQ